jgi:hypothetical protein
VPAGPPGGRRRDAVTHGTVVDVCRLAVSLLERCAHCPVPVPRDSKVPVTSAPLD